MTHRRRSGARSGAAWGAGLARLTTRACAAAVLACGGASPSLSLPTEARPGAELRPPRVGHTPAWSAPRLERARLANGLAVQLWARRSPLVELRLVLASGTASELAHPGALALASASLAPGRELAERLESLGARLGVRSTRDALSVSLSLPRSALAEGLPLLASLSQPPRWTPAEFERARRRQLERVRALSRTDASWAADLALYAELFRSGTRRHPYARFDALPGELERLTPEDCSAWYDAQVSPHNALLLAVGDLSLAQLLPLAQAALGGWQGKAVAPPVFFTPPAQRLYKTLLVNHPDSRTSELRVATLVPERRARDWLSLALARQVLGGPGPNRLQRDSSQRGEPDPRVSAALEDVAYGVTPFVIRAQASTERTASLLESLLASLASLAQQEPSARELLQAKEQLSAEPLWQLETSAGAAELSSRNYLLGLPDGELEASRPELERILASDVHSAALRHLKAPSVVVVVGDAARLVTPLSHFGQVHVLSPERDFHVERVVTQDPTAPLELSPLEP